MKLLLRYLYPLRRRMTLGFSIKVLATLLELTLPYVLSYILDEVVPMQRVTPILLWGGGMMLAAIGAFFGNVIANRMAARVARDAAERIRHDLFDATMHLTARETDRYTIPSLESRLTSDTYNVHSFIGMMQRMGVRAPILLFGGAIITLILDFRLALVMLTVLPLIGASVFLIARRGLPLFRKTQQSVDGMVRVVREDCQGVRVMKALSREDYERSRFDAANRALADNERRAGTVMAASQPLMTVLLNLGLVAVIALGALLVQRGVSAPGRIIAFMQYFTMLSTAMALITRIFAQYSKCMASASRIEEVLETHAAHQREAGGATPDADAPHVVFEDVCFSYNGKRENLSHLNFTLPRGGTLGIIGATGSGKSTLIQLMMRFYDVDSGRILLGGTDVRDYAEKDLRARFGVVMQNDVLFADSIAENLRLGRKIPDERLWRALRIAQVEDFVAQLPDGLSHILTTKGSNLSGGQRQRMLIARAIAGDPEILVLDDASSALDYRTDANLRRAVKEELNATTVVVAQRVSSVMHADLILVLEDGAVIGAGTHSELLASCAAYKEISDSQMGGAFLE